MIIRDIEMDKKSRKCVKYKISFVFTYILGTTIQIFKNILLLYLCFYTVL